MVLIDTSVWIDHFKKTDLELERLLNAENALTHPLVIGELACENFKNRELILRLINALPPIPEITKEEYYIFIERHRLFGIGLGFVDINLLASAVLAGCTIYTRNKALCSAAGMFGICFKNS
jgi:predicted nucleic acid-binding protein